MQVAWQDLQLMQVAWQDYEPVSGQDMPAACPHKETGGALGKLWGRVCKLRDAPGSLPKAFVGILPGR